MNITMFRLKAGAWKAKQRIADARAMMAAIIFAVMQWRDEAPQRIADWLTNESSLPLIPYCHDGKWIDVRIVAETDEAYHVIVPETGPRTWKQCFIRSGKNETIRKAELVVGQRPHARRRTYQNRAHPTAA